MNPSHPLEVEHLLTEDQRRLAIATSATRPPPVTIEEAGDIDRNADIGTTRARCIRKIVCLVGHGGLQSFLRNRQPALDDRSGAELLQNHPQELLVRLAELERSIP